MVGLWSCYIPTKVIFGINSVDKIAEAVDAFGPKKILIVAGKQSMERFGAVGKMLGFLEAYQTSVYSGVGQSPRINDVSDGVRFARKEKCNLVVGIGGGSVIDLAKSIATMSKNNVSVSDLLYSKSEIANKGLPMIAIPTTAGTGSEVTQYASIIDENKKKKISLTHDFLRPDVALLDPSLTVTMPGFVTATTGLDALSQCIEAFWSINHTPISDLLALDGIKLIFENLVKAFESPAEMKVRSNMLLASLFSGIGISIAKTTIVHSVSYPLTVHFGIPHGLACSLTLPSFIRYNSKTDDGRIMKMATAAGMKNIEEFVCRIEKLVLDLKLPTRLSEVGVKPENIDLIVKEGFRPDRAMNNPREIKAETLKELLNALL